jgi:hypothetical protein
MVAADHLAEPGGVLVSSEPPSKAERLEEAKRALTQAERSAKHREKKKREDPGFLAREAERMAARRMKAKSE